MNSKKMLQLLSVVLLGSLCATEVQSSYSGSGRARGDVTEYGARRRSKRAVNSGRQRGESRASREEKQRQKGQELGEVQEGFQLRSFAQAKPKGEAALNLRDSLAELGITENDEVILTVQEKDDIAAGRSPLSSNEAVHHQRLLASVLLVVNYPMYLLAYLSDSDISNSKFWLKQKFEWENARKGWKKYQPDFSPSVFKKLRSGKVKRYYRAQKFIEICDKMILAADFLSKNNKSQGSELIGVAAAKFADLANVYTDAKGKSVKYSEDPDIEQIAKRGALVLNALFEQLESSE